MEDKLKFLPKFKAVYANINELDFSEAMKGLKNIARKYIKDTPYKTILINPDIIDIEKYIKKGFNFCTHDKDIYLYINKDRLTNVKNCKNLSKNWKIYFIMIFI